MSKRIRKAVFPVAGLGTRFLPATKTVPKEMLPIIDRPLIQYAVDEAIEAGCDTLVFITNRYKHAVADYFDKAYELEQKLERAGKQEQLELIRHVLPNGVRAVFVTQAEALGLGHAVLCARQHVGDEPFAVLLGDDLIDARDELLSTMIDVQAKTGGSVIALIEVDPSQISAYGCADITPVDGENYFQVNRLVEKPSVDEAPSNLAVIGRYVLHPAVFDVLEKTEPGRGGEIQLTDALQTLATSDGEGSGVYGVVFRGRRYDTGDKLSYIKAVISIASERVDFGEDLKAWMKEFVNE